MSHIEIHTIKSKKYKYEVTNFRVGKKVKHKWKYLGPVEPLNKTQRKKGQGRKPEVFVRKLTEEEKLNLERVNKSGVAFSRDRARILLLSSKNVPAEEIAKNFPCDVRKVRTTIKSFNNKDFSSLQRIRPKGPAPKFTDMTKRVILMHFAKNPKDFGLYFSAWTLPRFQKHLIEYKVVESISIETVRQILMQSGAKLERSKRWQYSPDKEFDKKNLQ